MLQVHDLLLWLFTTISVWLSSDWCLLRYCEPRWPLSHTHGAMSTYDFSPDASPYSGTTTAVRVISFQANLNCFCLQFTSCYMIGAQIVHIWKELFIDRCPHCKGAGRVICKHCGGTKTLRRRPGEWHQVHGELLDRRADDQWVITASHTPAGLALNKAVAICMSQCFWVFLPLYHFKL